MVKFLIPLFALVLLIGCTPQTGNNSSATSSASSVTSSTAVLPSSSSSATMSSATSTKTYSFKGLNGELLTGKHTVVLHTSKGDITLELDADVAPMTVTNFVVLAQSGYYDKLTFHRVIPGFMIQGGDPNGNGTGGKSIFGDTFADEINANADLYAKTGYVEGVLAMANRGPNTNGSQFFIMDAEYQIAPNYTIFGHVTKGQDVVHKIATVARGKNDRPNDPITFTVEVVK